MQIDKPADPVSNWSIKMPPQLHDKVKNQSVRLPSWASVGLKNFHLRFIKGSWKPKNDLDETQLILCFCQNSELSTGHRLSGIKSHNFTRASFHGLAVSSKCWTDKPWFYVCLSRCKWKWQKARVQREKCHFMGLPLFWKSILAKKVSFSMAGRHAFMSLPASMLPFLL